MANDTPITVIGNLTADPELRFTPSGVAVASFTVASTPRHFDKASNEWVDDEALFLRCTVWRQPAENLVEGLIRGTRVVVVGRLVQRSYETKEGEKRTVYECQADEVAASTKFATVKVNRTGRASASPATADDPWATPAGESWASEPAGTPAAASSQQQAFADEPPF